MITRYLFQNPRIVWFVVATILVAGISCLSVMPRLEDPILKQRVAVITAELHGAAAFEIESSVTVPIEQWLNEFSEIKQVRSNTRANVTSIVLELEDEVTDPDSVWASIRSKLSSQSARLPDGCTAPELSVFPLKAFAAILAILPTDESNDDPFQHRRLAYDLRQRILNIDATESVDVFGDWDEEMTVQVSPKTLSGLGLNVASIATQIAEVNSVPGGDKEQGQMRVLIGLDESEQLEKQLGSTFIRSPATAEPVRLSEIADIKRSVPAPRNSEAIIQEKRSIVLGMMVDNDERVDHWTNRLDKVVAQFTNEFPNQYVVVPLFKQSSHVDQRMTSLLRNLGISTFAVAGIVFLLMGWRCMIVVAVSLPLSACLVICGLRFLEIPIHQMSITGLIVALGLLIDNSIVIVEEVRKRIFDGDGPLQAMVDAVGHLKIPLLGSTLTTILAFLPIATMPGPSGEFVGSLAVSVILAIGASFVLSMTLVPPLVYAIGVSEKRQGLFEYGLRLSPLAWLYRQSLRVTFRVPILGILLGIALPAIGFYFAQNLKKEFFPASDRAQLQVELELPASGTLAAVRESTRRVQCIIAEDNRVRRQHWFLGQSAPTFFYNVVPRRRQTPNYAQAFVDIESETDSDELVNTLQKKLDGEILDARVLVRKLEQGPPFDAPVEIRVFGEDLEFLQDIGDRVRYLMSENAWVTHTRSDLGTSIHRLSLDVDEGLVRKTGVTPKDVSKFLYTGLEGASAGSFYDHGDLIDVKVRVDYSDRSVVDTLSAMTVASPNQTTSLVTDPRAAQRGRPELPLLGSFGDFELKSDLGAVIRINGERVNEVKAYLRSGALPSSVTDELKEQIEASGITLPGNYRIEFGGETEKRTQAVSTLVANGVVLFSVMFLTLIATLGSLRSALIVASVGGLAVGLSPLALHWFGHPFGFMAIVGTMGLIGVAINDSIVVLAAIRANERLKNPGGSSDDVEQHGTGELRNEDASIKPLDEVVFGCTRHILTTTLTTMIGFLPLVIYGGKFWPPLAIVISAGVFGATVLALYFVPSVNLMMRRRRPEVR